MTKLEITEGSYNLIGLTYEDLDIIQEGLAFLFNQSRRDEHREFRRHILRINQPIDEELARRGTGYAGLHQSRGVHS